MNANEPPLHHHESKHTDSNSQDAHANLGSAAHGIIRAVGRLGRDGAVIVDGRHGDNSSGLRWVERHRGSEFSVIVMLIDALGAANFFRIVGFFWVLRNIRVIGGLVHVRAIVVVRAIIASRAFVVR